MKILYKFFTGIALLATTACNGYLDSDSADLQIPESVNDYAPLLLGEAYPDRFATGITFWSLMTDDVEMGPLQFPVRETRDATIYSNYRRDGIDPSAGYGSYAYTWASNYLSFLNDQFWDQRYHNIMVCNAIIENLPTMSHEASEEAAYRKLAYQAYTLRAYNYFCLVNTYAKPYTEENVNEPGVVLRTSSELNTSPMPRATIGEVYDLINSDIKNAETYIDGASNEGSKFEITKPAVYFLAARIALFQRNWDEVIRTGKKFIENNGSIYDLNNTDTASLGTYYSYSDTTVFLANDIHHGEVVFAFGRDDLYSSANTLIAPSGLSSYYQYGYHTSWTGDNALIPLYDKDDLRLKAYFHRPYFKASRNTIYAGQYKPFKNDDNASSTNHASQAWRSPEVYLDLAEAYAQKDGGVSGKAIDYLNRLREKKFVKGSEHATLSVADFKSKDDLVNFIWQERRRELCFEELMRLWDMKREGMPEQQHRYYNTADSYLTYTLRQGSPNYVLRIPQSETGYNSAIVNNEWENISGQ